jgi:acyl-coenzyme A thioesterase 9
MLAPLNPSRDLRLSGQVIYTGRSSMEVAVKMEAVGSESGSSEILADQTVLIGMSSCLDSLNLPHYLEPFGF